MSDLTEATKLTKGSIYGNFENKEEVALAAFDYNYGNVVKKISAGIATKHSCREKLLVYVEMYEHFLQQPFTPGGCPVLNTAVEADDTHPALKKKAADAIVSWKKSVCSIINKGVANGEFTTNPNAEQIAITLMALIEGGIMISKVTGNARYMKNVLLSLEKLIMDL